MKCTTGLPSTAVRGGRVGAWCVAMLGGLFALGGAAQTQEWLPLAPPSPEPVAVLVELHGAPAALRYAQALESVRSTGQIDTAGRGLAKSAAAGAVREQIENNQREQQAFEQALAASQRRRVALQPLYRVTKAMNALAYRVDASEVDALRALPGVKSVRIIDMEYPALSTSVPAIGAPSAWSGVNPLGVTGQGVRVAIIDSGVDYQHATFGGTGLLADYQVNDRTQVGDGFFPNARVVGGTDLAGDSYNGGNTPVPDDDPMDCGGHGTHVASTAAGGGVNADGTPYTGPYDTSTPFSTLRLGPGVAPQASVYAVRVFGCTGGTRLVVPAIEWALDPDGDGDMSDHVDVINMSIGSLYGTLAHTSSVAADNAARMGVVVVVSAGNSGDTYTISGSPGSGQQVLTVAAVEDDGIPGTAIMVNTPPAIAGTYAAGASTMVDANGMETAAAAGQTGDVFLALDPMDGAGPLGTDACSPLTNAAAVSGKIALVDRGTCTFAIKYQNVRDAGAMGMLVVDNVAAAPTDLVGGPIVGTVNIPAARLTKADGDAIKARLTAGDVVNVTFQPVSHANILAAFSSRGPRAGFDGVKPDIAAPGVNIVAAQTGVTPSTYEPGSRTTVMSGTSMAAPHVAGMMALLKERFPGRSVEALKAMAMNTALNDVYQFTGQVNRVGVDRVGAGAIDPVRALQSSVTAANADEPGAVSLAFFGEVVGADTRRKRLRVNNEGTTAQTFSLDFDIANDAPGISFSLPGGNSVTVPAGGSVIVEVQVDSIAAQMHHVRDASAAATQVAPTPLQSLGAVPRHYLTNKSGHVRFSQGGLAVLRAPVYAALRPASAMAAASAIVTGGAASGNTTLALTGQGVCTGTLVAGAACNGPRPQTDMSLVSPFEWQVDAPQKLAIPASANIRHAGVAYDGTRLLFGVSTWGDWGSPAETVFNIYIDRDNDGVWDRVLFNSNPGSMARNLFSQNQASGQDSFITGAFNRTTNGVSILTSLNGAGAASANTVVFGTNALFLVATPAQLGITPGTRFAYKVVTCPESSPLCQELSTPSYDEAAGPYTWNTSEQGLNFGNSPLAPDLDGASLPVQWNTAHMATNGSLGAMLIHHHNAAGQRVQLIPLAGAATADLAIAQTAAPMPPTQGQNVTITLVASNNGPLAGTGVSVGALLPAGLSYVSDDGGGAYNSSTGNWTIGALGSGASVTLHIVARVDVSSAITVASHISGTLTDPVVGNNNASSTFTALAPVVVPPTTTFALTHVLTTANPVQMGAAAGFMVSVRNTGANALLNVTVATPRTPAAAIASATPSSGSFNSGTGVWTIPNVAVGATATLALTVTAPNVAGNLTVNAQASAQNAPAASQAASVQVVLPGGLTPSAPVNVPVLSMPALALLVLALFGWGAVRMRQRESR